MTDPTSRELERARRELDAARALLDAGFTEKTVSSAYYATFHAAVAALLTLGETRSKHSGVVSTFGQLVVKAGDFDRRTGRSLRRLFEHRNDVDYGLEYPTREQAASALHEAERFVREVEGWIADRAPGA